VLRRRAPEGEDRLQKWEAYIFKYRFWSISPNDEVAAHASLGLAVGVLAWGGVQN
jgi:hypothetical protein